jgi:ATP-dependent DNA helicase DinG
VLFGLDSIAEGVDLPGEYCTLVIADKLPFPSMSDPILAAHVEHLEARGMHAFPHLMLPRASIKLAQVAGRLVRTETDYGDFWILDPRAVEKSDGPLLLRSLPFDGVVRANC